ncbi:DUF1593 domain-containing protein [Rheinheimera aquimaris]|uniref:DUF1593 domain-containing protein n=1 Tax=Rheinheimera aquimaris TaxID=412437 RepID=A0ABN1E6I0_9GAMM|nr:DUF1593 domain-containing protein [Rheinheimera aquimaris]MCB5214371.1 DUF1593 domain-containing protein [Rheinheimera aquimaris]
MFHFPLLLRLTQLLLLWSVISLQMVAAEATVEKQRVLVLTDIEADPDDAQSLIRLLLYANQIDIEGLVATTSVHQKNRVVPETILSILDAYAKVQPNLLLHEAGYPNAAQLKALVKPALPLYGMQGVGEGKDSAGSDWLLQVLQKPDPRPLWLSIWGGSNTLAQALYRLKQRLPEAQLQQQISRLRVYSISDQDDSAGWIRQQFPTLFYIVSPGGYGAATWTGINTVVEGIDNSSISNPWLANHIQQGHGPLGALYPDVAYGMEGDTPAWLGLIPNGLNQPERPDWGGWGGRYQLYIPKLSDTDPKGFTGGVPVLQESRPIWTNAVDRYSPPQLADYGRALRPGQQSFSGFRETLWRWRDAIQQDFAARMDWAILPYASANHPPRPQLRHATELTVKSGASFHLDARDSTDPDGDSLQYFWFHYPEAGSAPRPQLSINSAENMARVHLIAPQVNKAETLHFILQLTDRGSPALTRYLRVRVTVEPDSYSQ